MTAVLFRIALDQLSERLGPQTAIGLLKTLGEYVNKHFTPLGGFSTRHSRGRILTILPIYSPKRLKDQSKNLPRELQQKAVPEILKGVQECFEIAVSAGITEAAPADEIEQIIEKASARQKIIAKYQLKKEINVQMKKYSMESVVGIFVVIGLLCVGYMTIKLGKVSLFGDDYYVLYARFGSVSGLRVDSQVEINGIEVGRVDG